MPQLLEMGWKINSHSFCNANKHFYEIGPGFEIPIPIRIATKSNTAKEFVREFFYLSEITHEAAKGTVKKKIKFIIDNIEYIEKIDVPIRFLQNSISTCYRMFCEKYENINISETIFRKLKPKEIKEASRRTDLCDICESNKLLEKQIKKLKKNNQTIPLDLIELQTTYQEHIELVKIMRNYFKDQSTKLEEETEIQIVMDLKQNLKLMKATNEIGRDFYTRPARAVLDVCVIQKNQGNITNKHFTYISEILSKNATYVNDCLQTTLDKYPNVKKIHIWSDNCGGQFKNSGFTAKVIDLSRKYNLVTVNFFAPKYGKNVCDG